MNIEQKHIEGLTRGSYKDFTQLYELYSPLLYAFILSLTHSESAAKDIVQETFVKIWIERKNISLEKSFKSYLFTIARNQTLNEFRKQINKSESLEENKLENQTKYAENNIEKEINLNEFQHSLQKAKKKLTPRQCEFFELNKEQGISVSEIAAKTSVSEQSIRNQISQAIIRLRKEMKDFYILFSLFFIH